MPRTKQAKEVIPDSSESKIKPENEIISEISNGEYREIDCRLIQPSATNPRGNFNPSELDELASSIKRIGVQQPILVRPLKELPENLLLEFQNLTDDFEAKKKIENQTKEAAKLDGSDKNCKIYARALEKYADAERLLSDFIKTDLAGYGYELIAGERRWRASILSGRKTVPSIIKKVSDTEAFEIQIIENLQRKDIEPLDEARGYKNLMEKAAYSIFDIALRVGKSDSFIHQRLRLNDLIEPGQKDLSAGNLPIGHALEIAKYSADIQTFLLKEVYKWNEVVSFSELKRIIERSVLILLKHAPFSLKAGDLRADGLACTDCPARTGAAPTLFDKPKASEDACLNKKCFASKTENFIKIQRDSLTAQGREEKSDKKYSAPLISSVSYDRHPTALGWSQYTKIENKKSACASAEAAIYVDGDRIAQKQLICRDRNCPTHNRADSKKTPEKEAEDRLKRKEELFDYRTGKRAQVRVLKEAMLKFGDVQFTNVSVNAGWLEELLARLWATQSYHDSNVMGIIKSIIEEWADDKIPSYFSTEQDRIEIIGIFATEKQLQLLFLFLNAYKGAMFYESYNSQKEVRQLAEIYDVNYRLIDAEERYNLCIEPKSQYKKHASVFKEYMDEVRDGKDVKLPRVYYAAYKAKD